MGYRKHEHHHPPKTSDMHDVASVGTIYVTNGGITNFAIPCWYNEVDRPIPAKGHAHKYHDWLGQPQPKHPDRVCQTPQLVELIGEHQEGLYRQLIDPNTLTPIHFKDEGYTEVSVALSPDKPEGLVAEGSIDQEEDWIIRVVVTADCEAAIEKEVRCKYAIRIKAADRVDVVSVGEIVILPAVI